jgi:hypothetical protein
LMKQSTVTNNMLKIETRANVSYMSRACQLCPLWSTNGTLSGQDGHAPKIKEQYAVERSELVPGGACARRSPRWQQQNLTDDADKKANREDGVNAQEPTHKVLEGHPK